MAIDVLVAYATKHGSTREVAEAVASELRDRPLTVELRELGGACDLDRYRAVVIGAPLYMGRWHKDARGFLRHNRAALGTLPVAVFAVGPLKNTEAEVRGSRAQLDKALATADWLRPVSVAIFGGVVSPEELRFPFSHMPAGDARDWEAIRAWARALGGSFRERDRDLAGLPVAGDGEGHLLAGLAAVDEGS